MKKLILPILVLFFCIETESAAQLKYTIPYPKPMRTAPDTVSVIILGDVMMHSRQLEYDYRTFLKNIAPSMKQADICAANMEFTLAGEPYTGYPSFSAPDGYAACLAEDCGADVFLLANNHILDKGAAGLSRTISAYRNLKKKYGTEFTGAAESMEDRSASYPLILMRKGVRIAFINFTYGTNIGPDRRWPDANRMKKDEVKLAIDSAREQGADFIIALPHWGEEYQLRHSKSQQEWAEWLAAQGVDAIVGAHPHVIQDSAMIGDVPVYYSLGNAISNMSVINTRLGLAVTLRFTIDFSGTEKKMLPPAAEYFWCTLPGMLTDSYSTVYVKEWATRRSEWSTPSDFDNMMSTYARVKKETGVED